MLRDAEQPFSPALLGQQLVTLQQEQPQPDLRQLSITTSVHPSWLKYADPKSYLFKVLELVCFILK